MRFRTPVLTKFITWPQSNCMFDIYFPECLESKVSISEYKIDFANFFCNSPAIMFPIFKIFNLAKYNESPLDAKATIIARGISQANV